VWTKSNGYELLLDDAVAAYVLAADGNFQLEGNTLKFSALVTGSDSAVSVAPNWGRTWRRYKNEESGTRKGRIAFIGDSVGTGQYATTVASPATRFNGGVSDLIRVAMQADHGDGGSGWRDFENMTDVFSGLYPGFGAQTGAWTRLVSTGGAINNAAQKPTVAGNGATITFPFDGTTMELWTQTDPTFGSITYNIDGAGAVVVAQNAAASLQKTVVNGLAPGAHNVVVTASVGNSKVIGVRGLNNLGVVVDNFSSRGRAYAQGTGGLWLQATDGWAAKNTMVNTLESLAPSVDVVIIALGLNDMSSDNEVFADAAFHSLAATWLELQKYEPVYGYPPDIIVCCPHFGRGETDVLHPEAAKLAVQLRQFATSIGAAYVDWWRMGLNSWKYWDTLGAWPSPFGTPDDVHPSSVGHALMAQPIIDLLRAA
jgi:lysophospholipase L1-like esterase